jgi:hypothetical protein
MCFFRAKREVREFFGILAFRLPAAGGLVLSGILAVIIPVRTLIFGAGGSFCIIFSRKAIFLLLLVFFS